MPRGQCLLLAHLADFAGRLVASWPQMLIVICRQDQGSHVRAHRRIARASAPSRIDGVLTLFYRTACPFSLATRLVLVEKGLAFVRRIVKKREKPPEIERVSRGKVPALLDDSFGVFESSVIAEYLEEAFSRPPLRPPDPRGRALLRMAIHKLEHELLHPLEELEDASQGAAAERERIVAAFTPWEHRMGDNGHLFGVDFSLADAWLASAVAKAALLGIPLPPGFTRLSVWWRRMQERDSVRAERLAPEA
jgi:glutathione S-transferase